MKLTDDELLVLVDRYDLGDLQEAVLAELDDTELTLVSDLAVAVGKSPEGLRTKVRRMARQGLVRVERGKGGVYLLRLPAEWPEAHTR